MADEDIIAQMMADLGVERRDNVSAPDDDRGGRMGFRQEADILAQDNARRAQFTKADNAEGDERATRLRAWNTAGTFAQDEVSGQLQNRFNGQGHRAALNGISQHQQHRDQHEAFDARYGEERRLYVEQQRGRNRNNYLASNQAKFKGILGSGASVPRTFSGTKSDYGPLAGGRANPAPAPSRARAPSPRSYGTTRFGPGGQRTSTATARREALANPGAQIAAAMRAAAKKAPNPQQSHTTPADATTTKTSNAPTPAPEAKTQTTPANVTVTKTSDAQKAAPAAKTQTNSAITVAPVRAEAATTPCPVPTPSPQANVRTPGEADKKSIRDPIRVQMYINQALGYAAKPGRECDIFYEKFPDRLRYLGPARDRLIKEATTIASKMDNLETARYLQTHPDRTWMVEAAQKAKLQVENDTDHEIVEYCVEHPRQQMFVDAAKAIFTPKQQGQFTSTPSEPQTPAAPMPSSTVNTRSSIPVTTDSSSVTSGTSEESADTASSAPSRLALGLLTAAFYGVGGKFLGIHQVKIGAPVLAKIDLTSIGRRYDPRQLIADIEALANSMVNRSHGLTGVRLARDGVWEEDN